MASTLNKLAAAAALQAACVEHRGFELDDERAEQLVTEYGIKSQKKAVEVAQSIRKPSANKGRIRTERVIEPGARGFRFAGKWNEAVEAASGIAIHPFYYPKLKAHAKAFNVSIKGKSPQEICQAIVAAGGPEVPVEEEAAA